MNVKQIFVSLMTNSLLIKERRGGVCKIYEV